MAATATPSLAVPRESQPYAPVSWAAVAAIASAAIFVFALLFYGLQSFLKKQPLLDNMFIGMPILTLVLALIAWLHVRNSEGTRTGMKLAVVSFWVGLVGGLGYGSYLLAISLAVRIEAEKQFLDWAKDLNDLDPDNPADPSLYRALHKTMLPGLRSGVSPSDVASMNRRFGSQLAGFRQSDLVSVCYRNRGQCKFAPQGLVHWTQTPKTMQEPAKVDATLACTLECPEGVYGLNVMMRATTDDAGRREWQLVPNAEGMLKSARLTDYGRRLYELKNSAVQTAGRFLYFAQNPAIQDRGYLFFVKNPYTVAAEESYSQKHLYPSEAALAVVGTTAVVDRSVLGYEADLFGRAFVPLMGTDAPKAPEDRKKKEEEMRKQFGFVWNAGRLRVPGALVKDNPDKDAVLVVGDKQIELRYPIELALPGGESSANTARGRIVFVCDDPAVLAEVKKERETANPADATDFMTPIPNWKSLHSAWRIARIESDMNPVPVAQPQGDRMPGGG